MELSFRASARRSVLPHIRRHALQGKWTSLLSRPVSILIVATLALNLSAVSWSIQPSFAQADEPSEGMSPSPDQPEDLEVFQQPSEELGAAKGAGSDSCLDNLKVPSLKPGSHRVVQLVNCSNQTLLGSANAAQQQGLNPLPALPEEGTWVMGPAGKGANVLTIDIPPGWENTKCPAGKKECEGIVGPRFWARTGCRYDLNWDKAQCETGGCGGRYDCSAARLSASVGTTVAEWTFNEPVANLTPAEMPPNDWCAGVGNPPSGTNMNGQPIIAWCKDSPDISAVDGANLNMDIEPAICDNQSQSFFKDTSCTEKYGHKTSPFDSKGPTPGVPNHDFQWLAANYPLTSHGDDLRANCTVDGFKLKRSDLTIGSKRTGDTYGMVMVNAGKQPIDASGNVDDSTVACFSNCGQYAYPVPPAEKCDENAAGAAGAHCYRWKAFCLGDPSKYGVNTKSICTGNKQCPVAGVCWDLHSNGQNPIDNTCQGRAFVKKKSCLPGPSPNFDPPADDKCPEITFPYGYVDPVNKQLNYGSQPPVGSCTDVANKNAPFSPDICIGDDTLHEVMPKAYTWPNDPQVYGGDSNVYRVVFSPGGTTQKITPLSTIPSCLDIDGPKQGNGVYHLKEAKRDCAGPIQYGALFALAVPGLINNTATAWSCDLDPSGAGDNGLLCRWPQVDELKNNVKVQQIGMRVNFNQAGSDLTLSVVPGAQAGDLLLASMTYLGTAGEPQIFDGTNAASPGWSQIAGVNSPKNHRTAVWFHVVGNGDFQSNPSRTYRWAWNQIAFPAGALTVWRGVDSSKFVSATASGQGPQTTNKGDNGPVAFAQAPAVTTDTPNSRVISIFGAGGANKPNFDLPTDSNNAGDETGAAKLVGGPSGGTYYGHYVADRIQPPKGPVSQQQSKITQSAMPPVTNGINWEAITIVLKPSS